MLFDNLDDHEAALTQKPAETQQDAEADAWRRSFGTKAPKPLKPAKQDGLFDPNPQGRLL